MANLAGVVQLLEKEHGRLTKELQGISAALAAFSKSYGKQTVIDHLKTWFSELLPDHGI